jgi:hypothetical protein
MADDDAPVGIGAGIFALHDPHRGYERAFNRYYERDHMYAAAILAPWTIAGQRFVATADLKAMRYKPTLVRRSRWHCKGSATSASPAPRIDEWRSFMVDVLGRR